MLNSAVFNRDWNIAWNKSYLLWSLRFSKGSALGKSTGGKNATHLTWDNPYGLLNGKCGESSQYFIIFSSRML